jgi:hypothetical protein
VNGSSRDQAPADVADEIWGLGEAGFEDAGILDMPFTTTYLAFVNRTADGLGVAVQEYWE